MKRKKSLKARYIFLGVFTALAAAVLLGRLVEWQLFQSEYYENISATSASYTVKTDAVRGEIFDKNGVELAKLITRHHPHCSIIFLTGHSEYMEPAFGIHASGYLLKPFSLDMLREALDHRRYRNTDPNEKPVKVQCFGSFEVFTKNIPVQFSRKKTKELFAILIDCRGEKCDVDTIIRRMEPTAEINRSARSRIRVFLSDLTKTFENIGINDIVIKEGNSFGINMSLIDCDYYRLIDGDTFARSQYIGKYMIQYEFAENTRAWLFEKNLKK